MRSKEGIVEDGSVSFRALSRWNRRFESLFVRFPITGVTSSSFRFARLIAELGDGQVVFRSEASLETKRALSLHNQRSNDSERY
jgi:hypothetical protein